MLPWRLRWWRICPQCWRPRSDPWAGKMPWRRGWQPTPLFRVGHDWVINTHTDWLHEWNLTFLISLLQHHLLLLDHLTTFTLLVTPRFFNCIRQLSLVCAHADWEQCKMSIYLMYISLCVCIHIYINNMYTFPSIFVINVYVCNKTSRFWLLTFFLFLWFDIPFSKSRRSE